MLRREKMLHNSDVHLIKKKAQLFKIHEPSWCCFDIDIGVGVDEAILRDEL